MNLRFVEAFYWAVTLKSVTRAAEKLFITQSALSSRIAALEAELGVLLLDRRDKQFRLTTAGTRFHRHAERLLNLQRDIKAEFGKTLLRQDNLQSRHIALIDGHLKMRRGANHGDTADSTETAVVRCDLNIVRSDQGYAIARGMFGRKR